MKLHELLHESNDNQLMTLSNLYELNQRLANVYKIVKYAIDEDGSLNTDYCNLQNLGLTQMPLKFNKVKGFKIHDNKLSSFENFPVICDGLIDFDYNKITSFVGVNDVIKTANYLSFYHNPITEGGLGLILIDGLTEIYFNTTEKRITPAFQIIRRYLGKPNDIFECQNELIEAGLDEFAQI